MIPFIHRKDHIVHMMRNLLSERMSREEIRTKNVPRSLLRGKAGNRCLEVDVDTSARTPGNRKAAAERKERAPTAGTQSACTVLAISTISTGGAKAQS